MAISLQIENVKQYDISPVAVDVRTQLSQFSYYLLLSWQIKRIECKISERSWDENEKKIWFVIYVVYVLERNVDLICMHGMAIQFVHICCGLFSSLSHFFTSFIRWIRLRIRKYTPLHRTSHSELWLFVFFFFLFSFFHLFFPPHTGMCTRAYANQKKSLSRLACKSAFYDSKISPRSIFYWNQIILALPRSSQLRCRWCKLMCAAGCGCSYQYRHTHTTHTNMESDND